MNKKIKKAGNNETSRQGINQFIIECMFSKYFDEQKVNAAVDKKEEVKV